MASMHDLFIKEETLETLLKTVREKKEKGVKITIVINDDFNQYDQNVSSFVSQSKEQVADKKQKYYVGNGRSFWSTNGDHPQKDKPKVQAKAGHEPQAVEVVEVFDDLPF